MGKREVPMLARFCALILSLLALAVPAFADDRTISGEVFYRERIALPPGSTLHVSLVTLPAARPVASASAAIPPRGGSPLQFSLALHTGLSASARYGLVAEIRSGDGIIFKTTAPVAVSLPLTAPIGIMVSRYTAPPSAPDAPAEPPIDQALVGKTWQVTSVSGRPVVSAQPITLTIAPDLRVDGHAGCNDYFTEASLTPGRIQFSQAATTRKACSADLMAQERSFLAALAAIGAYQVEEKVLRLLDRAGIPLIGLIEAAE
jgi:putative lipoprotein